MTTDHEHDSTFWHRREADLRTDIAAAEHELQAHDAAEAEAVSALAGGVAVATKAPTTDRAALERRLAQLRAALDEAGRHRAQADAAEQVADRARIVAEGQDLMRKRILAAEQFDQALAAAFRAWERWEELGDDLQGNAWVTQGMTLTSHFESTFGSGRVLAALPGFLKGFFRDSPTAAIPFRPLAEAEANTWDRRLAYRAG